MLITVLGCASADGVVIVVDFFALCYLHFQFGYRRPRETDRRPAAAAAAAAAAGIINTAGGEHIAHTVRPSYDIRDPAF